MTFWRGPWPDWNSPLWIRQRMKSKMYALPRYIASRVTTRDTAVSCHNLTRRQSRHCTVTLSHCHSVMPPGASHDTTAPVEIHLQCGAAARLGIDFYSSPSPLSRLPILTKVALLISLGPIVAWLGWTRTVLRRERC